MKLTEKDEAQFLINVNKGKSKSYKIGNETKKLPKIRFVEPKRNKYLNKKTVVDGITFDSKKEAEYYSTLKLLKRKGKIKDFKCQLRIPLEVNGSLVCKIVLDFQVWYDDGRVEYIDIKAFNEKTGKYISTSKWKVQKKLFEAIYGFKIKIV